MALSLLFNDPLMLIPFLGMFLMAFTVHEFSHGWVAYLFGDDTAKRMGRLTLNPIPHLDPVGTISLLIGFIGWGKPVPVNPRNLRRPRQDGVWISAAGPFSNMILAVGTSLIVFSIPESVIVYLLERPGWPELLLQLLAVGSFFGVLFNLVLAIFNLLPFFPLDGEKIVLGLAPEKYVPRILEARRYGMAFILGLFALSYFFHISVVGRIVFPLLGMMLPDWALYTALMILGS